MAENQNAAASAPPARAGATLRKKLILCTIVGAALFVGGRMWWRSQYFAETDNAYLDANVTMVSPRVAGTVVRVHVRDNQQVRAGELLVELDETDQRLKVQQVKAQLAEVDAKLRQVDAQVQQSQAELASAQAQAERTEAQARRARTDSLRYQAAFKEEMRAVSKQELDNAVAASEAAGSEWRAHREQATAAHAKLSSVAASKAILLAQKDVLQAQLQEAELHLGYNRIVAPVSGRIGKKSVELGARIALGQQVLAIVQDGVWVNANFKETQLGGLLPGQRVSVHVDALPGQEFAGRIDSFSPASGAHFALLPPDNATGNFTKIVQRVPVKIVLDAASVAEHRQRLAPGMSAVVEIDLRQEPPAAPAAPAGAERAL
jgi:membrane fusion protein (multidrug efflux system)